MEKHRFWKDRKMAKALSDNTRFRIVELLSEEELTNTMLAKRLGISKATVTHHMKILLEAGAVEVIRVEESRGIPKKYYGLSYKITGMGGSISEPLSQEMEREFRKLVQKKRFRKKLTDEVNISFLRLYRSALFSAGADFDPMLFDRGYQVGRSVFSEVVGGENIEDVLSSLGRLWEDLNLGRLEVEEVGETTSVVISDCYQCTEMPNLGKPLCASDEGIITGVLEKKLHSRFKVKEIECWGTGKEHCRFEIKSGARGVA